MSVRVYRLHRTEDPSGVSGTGDVAEAVEFENGKVAVSFFGAVSSVIVYDKFSDAVTIHGHGGKTEFLYLGQYLI